MIGWALIVGGVPLIVFTYWQFTDIEAIFPGVIGINLLLAGGRFLWFNLGVRETERARDERLASADARPRTTDMSTDLTFHVLLALAVVVICGHLSAGCSPRSASRR